MSLEPEQYHVKATALDFSPVANAVRAIRYIQERYGAAGRAWLPFVRDYGMSALRLGIADLPTPVARQQAADYLRRMAPTQSHDGRHAFQEVAEWIETEPGWASTLERIRLEQMLALKLKPLHGLPYDLDDGSHRIRVVNSTFAVGLDNRLWKWASAWYPQTRTMERGPAQPVYVTRVYEPRSLDVPLQTHTPHMGHKPGANWAAVENCPSCATPGSE